MASFFSEVRCWFFRSYVITQSIWNKFIQVNFCVGCMVSPPNSLFQDWTFVKYWWDVVFAFVYALCIISLWVLLINEMKSLSGTVEKWQIWLCIQITVISTEDGRSTSIFLLYGQLSQGWMANFPAFIVSKSFGLWNHHIPQIKWHNLRHILIH